MAIKMNYTWCRRILLRLPFLFAVDWVLRVPTIQSSVIKFAYLHYFIILIVVSILLLKEDHLDEIWKVITCFFFMIVAQPEQNKRPFIDSTLQMTNSLILKNDTKYFSHIYMQGGCVFLLLSVLLTGIHTVYSRLSSGFDKRVLVTLLVLTATSGMSLDGCCDISFFNSPNLVKIVLAVRYICSAFTTMYLFQLDSRILIILHFIHYKLGMYNDISSWYYCGVIFLWKFLKIKTLVPFSFSNGRNYLFTSLEMLLSTLTVYSIVVSVLLFNSSYQHYSTREYPIERIALLYVILINSTIVGNIIFVILIVLAVYYAVKTVIYLRMGQNHDLPKGYVFVPALPLLIAILSSSGNHYFIYSVMICFSLHLAFIEFLHIIHITCEPTLFGYGKSGSPLVYSCKILILFQFLLLFPLYVIYRFLYFEMDMIVTLIVIGNWLSISIKALGSQLVFVLLVYDRFKSKPFDQFDDFIYNIRTMTGICLSSLGVYTCFYAVSTIFSTRWSWISLVGLGVNTFVTYQRITEQYREYKRRRETVKLLPLLSNATKEELEEFHDVCAICLHGMTSAKTTQCRHYFHISCLRKWLYVRETCPMCNQKIVRK